MNKYTLVLLSFFVVSCSNKNCKNYDIGYIPENLSESIEYLECKIPEDDKEKFAETDELDIIGKYHLSLGKFIRNELGLWGMNSKLHTFFKSNNISHPETISSIIIKSFHRKLNNKDINFREQVIEHQNFLNQAVLRQKERELKALEFYESFKVNDTVEFDFDVDFSGHKKMKLLEHDYHTGMHCCPCKGKGIVSKKIGNDKFYGYEINVKLINYCDYANLWKDGKILEKGDTISYYIERHNIKKYR